MLGNRAKMNSHDIPWGEDNGQVRAARASVDISPIRVRGRFGCLCRPVRTTGGRRPGWDGRLDRVYR